MSNKESITTPSFPVPLRIVIEARRSARVALLKKQIILRIPKAMGATQRKKVTSELLGWAEKTIKEKNLYPPVNPDQFEQGKTITVMGKPFTIVHQYVPGNSSAVHLGSSGEIRLKLPIHLSQDSEAKRALAQKLLIAGFNKLFLPDMQKRVMELNREHFNAEIGRISLRYTTSRWGSCSSEGSISLSTKLLLVPPIVCDYVIIHELAHRFEMNHSHRFWALVEHAMPDYKTHLQWLKTEGSRLAF